MIQAHSYMQDFTDKFKHMGLSCKFTAQMRYVLKASNTLEFIRNSQDL